jgi:hemerythrin
MFRWDESYSVKVEVIDEQHKQLFEAVRRFSEAIESDQAPAEFLSLLDFLINYSRHHFAEEEKFFAAFAYEEAESHSQQHRAFIDIVLSYRRRFEADELILPQEVIRFLQNWLTEHVMSSDQRYAACFHEHGPK